MNDTIGRVTCPKCGQPTNLNMGYLLIKGRVCAFCDAPLPESDKDEREP